MSSAGKIFLGPGCETGLFFFSAMKTLLIGLIHYANPVYVDTSSCMLITTKVGF